MADPRRFPRRLIEVDLPIKAISAHARREKSIRHGHISTLHIWWARRPLAACRAVILAALWPDPADDLCPGPFRAEAAREMKGHRDRLGGKVRNWTDPVEIRAALLDFLADFANWDNSTNHNFIEPARRLVRVAHESLGGIPGARPLVVDPFAGGGSVPLEALRVGAEAFASDLNPVALLLNQVLLQDIPRFGTNLSALLRECGNELGQRATRALSGAYPRDPDGAVPVAYLWARTVTCEGPGCGAEVPILPSLWLEKTPRCRAFYEVASDTSNRRVQLRVVQIPASGRAIKRPGTVRRGSVTCPVCCFTTAAPSVRRQLHGRLGGARDARMLAVVTTRPGEAGRRYRNPTQNDLGAYLKATTLLRESERGDGPQALASVPSEELPLMSGVFNVPLYGHTTWGSLFNARQLLTMVEMSRAVREFRLPGQPKDLERAVRTLLAVAVDRLADYLSSICTWVPNGGFIGHTFAQGQSLPIKFDYAEGCPFADGSGNWAGAIDWVARVVESCAAARLQEGVVQQADARSSPLPTDSADAIVTDPPYYNAVPYADLSDFFYVWMKRSIGDIYPQLMSSTTSPKDAEICEMAGWDRRRYAHKDARYYEVGMRDSVEDMRRVLRPTGLMVVVFAHKTTSGWEALLQALVDAGWTITASWPIDTERGGRLRAMNSAALGSSVHLVCRPRENLDGSLQTPAIGDWRAVLGELPGRIHEWLPRLAQEGIVGADAIFACLGPALEVFSRYSRVEKASGDQVCLREYLEHVWAAVSREALSMIFEDADATGLEEDARLTAMWLWTLSTAAIPDQEGGANEPDDEMPVEGEEEEGGDDASVAPGKRTRGFVLEFDAARKIAQGLGAHIEHLGNVVEVRGETAWLLSVVERTTVLFGKQGPAPAQKARKAKQLSMFGEPDAERREAEWGDLGLPEAGKTTLDRVHQAMILFGAGRSEAMKRFIVDEGVGRDGRFWKLAQSLSALYPAGTDEKRWVDGVLARKKGLGF